MSKDIITRLEEWFGLPPRIERGGESGIEIIRHPLCVELYHDKVGLSHAHQFIAQQRGLCRSHMVRADWNAILTLVARAYRAEALFMMWDAIPPSLRGATFAWVWTDTEEPDQPAWHRLWARVEKPVFDGYAARMWFDEIGKDELITVYRGGKSQNRSWALSRDVAVFFTKRFARTKGELTVQTREIKKAQIQGVFFDRKEREIVLEIQP